ncbi:MAG: sulfotransferase [Fimbriimonas sp.]
MNETNRSGMQAAESAFKAGDFPECLRLCQQVLATNPKSLPALVMSGMVAVRTDSPHAALQPLREAIQIDPMCFEALLWLGIALRKSGDLAEAVTIFRRSTRIWPDHAGAHANLGLTYLDLHQGAKAVASLERAMSLNPKDPTLYHNLGVAYQQTGEGDRAERFFERAIELQPDLMVSLISLGLIYLEHSKRTEAIAAFRRAHAIAPDSARGNIQLARALREEGDLDGSLAALHRALELEPDSVDALEGVSNLQQQMGLFDEAIASLNRAIELDPKRSRLYFNRISCRRATEDDRPTLVHMEHMLAEGSLDWPDRRYLHYGLAKAYNDLKETEPAMDHYVEANRAMRELLGNKPFEREIHTREFDKKIETFTPEFFRRYESVGNPSEVPVLIIGMIRSGTSLVEQILSAHPEVGGGGELPYWFQHAYEVMSVHGELASASVIRRVQADYLALLRDISPETPRVTDKMPHNYMFLGHIHAAFPNAKFVHCRRNPVDNCLSIYMTPYQAPLDFAHDRANIAFVYREYLRLMEHWRKVIPADRLIEVDYETLVENPEATTRNMIEFLGLDWDEACLRPEDNTRVVKTPSMWQVRQPVYNTSVERWRKYEKWIPEFTKLA